MPAPFHRGVSLQDATDAQLRSKWRLVIDMRHLNLCWAVYNMRFETLRRLRYLACKGDWEFSFDLQDGYYALGLREDVR
eukprot:jgi/Tetstr1/465854/TSEL_010473.t1